MQKVKLKYSNYMKQLFIYSIAAVLSLTACSNDRELGGNDSQTQANAIGFQVIKKNVLVRGGGTTIGPSSTTQLENAGHYNFGVFAYKNSDATNNIMENYLVGYHGTNIGYDYNTNNAGWYYEGLGSSQYTYEGNDYYKQSDNFYMSNVGTQYLRYWDNSSESTSFYAYAPYINGDKAVTYANGNKTMSFPAGAIVDGYDDSSKYEYMYANSTVQQNAYGQNVQLKFHRLSAKVNIKFYEDIAGYSVKMLNLGNNYTGICAAPAKRSDSTPYTYTYGKLYQSAGVSIDFSQTTITPTWSYQDEYSTANGSNSFIQFAIPTGDDTNGYIGTENTQSSPSSTTYFAIPQQADGLTFHVSYQLISTTGETINVYNAKVFVPSNWCIWEANRAYTYVFKITKNSSGTTTGDSDIDPSSPDATDEKALYPIIFENCTVEDWVVENNYEEDINN